MSLSRNFNQPLSVARSSVEMLSIRILRDVIWAGVVGVPEFPQHAWKNELRSDSVSGKDESLEEMTC